VIYITGLVVGASKVKFSTHLHRMQQVLKISEQYHPKIPSCAAAAAKPTIKT
jgi:hypothetical protein